MLSFSSTNLLTSLYLISSTRRIVQSNSTLSSRCQLIVFSVICCIAAAALAFYAINRKNKLTDEKKSLEAQIQEKEYIEKIIAEHDAAKNRLDNAKAMEQATFHLNEQALTFIENVPQESACGTDRVGNSVFDFRAGLAPVDTLNRALAFGK